MIQTKFGLNWPSGFRGEDFWKSLQTDDGRQVMAIAHTGELKTRTVSDLTEWYPPFAILDSNHIPYIVYYNCVKFHKNSISKLSRSCAYKVHAPPPFSWKYTLKYLPF
jgi:hypothetical protein